MRYAKIVMMMMMMMDYGDDLKLKKRFGICEFKKIQI
tara:strand:+ start:240 stop:350 length:111 start_codon:yes stop_codon:yes gene_type:complete